MVKNLDSVETGHIWTPSMCSCSLAYYAAHMCKW